MPRLIEMVDSISHLKRRKRGADLIGLVAKSLPDALLVGDIKNLMFKCSMDTQWSIRKAVAVHLKDLIKDRLSKEMF